MRYPHRFASISYDERQVLVKEETCIQLIRFLENSSACSVISVFSLKEYNILRIGVDKCC